MKTKRIKKKLENLSDGDFRKFLTMITEEENRRGDIKRFMVNSVADMIKLVDEERYCIFDYYVDSQKFVSNENCLTDDGYTDLCRLVDPNTESVIIFDKNAYIIRRRDNAFAGRVVTFSVKKVKRIEQI